VEPILNYFPGLSSVQQEQLAELQDIYTFWNARINVISRKDMEFFYLHHVLHSLAVARVVQFRDGTQIMDLGTGGGFPGIPLAIVFPACRFHLVDSIGKKVRVVQDVAARLGLHNVAATQARGEAITATYDFVVSRAVTTLPEFWKWAAARLNPGGFNDIANGALYLKGGDFDHEITQLKTVCKTYHIASFFDEPYFSEKKVVHISSRSPKRISGETNNA